MGPRTNDSLQSKAAMGSEGEQASNTKSSDSEMDTLLEELENRPM